MLQISPHELHGLLVSNPQSAIIDVRFQREREETGYIEGAFHIPLYLPDWEPNPEFERELAKIASLNTTLVFVCRSGVRSCEACEIARREGYAHVYNLSEGYLGLVKLKSQAEQDDAPDLLRSSGQR